MRKVLFALLPEVVLLDIAGAAEAFRLASNLVPDAYDLQFVGTSSSLRSCVGGGGVKQARPPAPEAAGGVPVG